MLAVVKRMRLYRKARREFRALCESGRAPRLQIDVRIHPDDAEWTNLPVPGLTGLKTTIPLTKGGQRYVRESVREIEDTCVRAIVHDMHTRQSASQTKEG